MAAAAAAEPGGAQAPTGAAGGPEAARSLLERIWGGVQQAQQHATACGSLVESRTSPLLARPLVLRATFCVQGVTGFRISYSEPEPLTIIYRDKYVNVVHDRERRTEAFEAGAGVARAMEYFGPSASIDRITRDFRVDAEEGPRGYVLRMTPTTGRFKARVGSIVAEFDARDFRITRLEIAGRNGVTSDFDVRIEQLDVPLDPATFTLYRPGRGRAPRP
jgi:outer membrane lipoprotein-sorting protein